MVNDDGNNQTNIIVIIITTMIITVIGYVQEPKLYFSFSVIQSNVVDQLHCHTISLHLGFCRLFRLLYPL